MDINNIVLKACLAKGKKEFSKYNNELNNNQNLDELDGSGSRLVPFFLSKLNENELESVHQDRLKVIYRYFWLKSNFLEHETKRVCELLKEINVEPIIFKGMSLAYNYDNIAYRPTSDIDMLIPYGKFKLTMKSLMQNGYQFPKAYFNLIRLFPKWNYYFNGHAFFLFQEKKRIELDLHWSINHLVTKKGLDCILLNAINHPKFQNAKIPIIEHEAYISIIHGYYSSHYANWAIDLLMMKNLKEKFKTEKLWELAKIDGKMDTFQAALIKLKKYNIDFNEEFYQNNLTTSKHTLKAYSKYSAIQKLLNLKQGIDLIYGDNLTFYKKNQLLCKSLIFNIILKLFFSSKINKHINQYR